MKHSLIILAASILFICLPCYGQVNTQQIQFQDCTYIDFGETDYSTMTEAEKIQAMDNALFDALDNTEECMKSAISSESQGIANAANSNGGGSGSGSGSGSSSTSAMPNDSTENANESSQDIAQQNTTQSQSSSSAASKVSKGGPANMGSAGVCDTVITGLKNAETDTQKAHFEKLKDQYGC